MFNSITDPEVAERVPKSSPPWVWVGFLFAGAFFFMEILFVVLELEEASITPFLMLVALGGWIYYLVCVYRLHKILDEMTRSRYPISPARQPGNTLSRFTTCTGSSNGLPNCPNI